MQPLLVAAAAALVGIALCSPALRWLPRRLIQAISRARARAAQFEERLAESRQRFQDFAEASSDWFWRRPDLRFTYMSERIRDVLGFDPAYTIGKRREDLSDMSREPEHWARHLDDLRAYRPFRDFTYQLCLPDQQIRYISVSGKPIFGAAGQFLGYRGSGRDATAAVLGDQALKKQTRFVLDLIEKLPFGVTLFDANLRTIAFNERFLEVLELPRDRFKAGDPFEHFIRFNVERGDFGQGDLEAIVRDRLASAALREPRRYERRRPNGQVIEIFHVPLPDGGFVRTYLDITQRKAAEERVRESETRFRDFADYLTDWLWEQDAELRFTYLSHGALERFRTLPATTSSAASARTLSRSASSTSNGRDISPTSGRAARSATSACRAPISKGCSAGARSAAGRSSTRTAASPAIAAPAATSRARPWRSSAPPRPRPSSGRRPRRWRRCSRT